MISWMSKKKTYVAVNAVEEEYIVANLAICEVVWLQKLLEILFNKALELNVIYCDNLKYVKITEKSSFP